MTKEVLHTRFWFFALLHGNHGEQSAGSTRCGGLFEKYSFAVSPFHHRYLNDAESTVVI